MNICYNESSSKDNDILDEVTNKIYNFVNEENYEEKIYETKDLDIVLAFSDLRKNIINWYDVNSDSSVLEIGGNYGEITGALCEKFKNVSTIESSYKKAKIIAKRYENIDNLNIYVGKLDQVEINNKFDYITVFNNLNDLNEIYGYFSNSYEGLINLLNYLKKFLNDDGKILLAFDNKYGIRLLTGEVNENNPFDNFTDKSTLLTKNQIEDIIRKTGYKNAKFFYPLPDYKLASVIYSDDFLPKNNTAKVNYNLYYTKKSNILFNELNAINTVIKDDKFKDFCNSYIVEISNSDDLSKVKFICFNNIRKDEYRLITKIYDEKVIKESVNIKSKIFIENYKNNIDNLKSLGLNSIESYTDDKIISIFNKNETVSEYLKNKLINNEIKEFYKFIDLWFNLLKTKLGVSKIKMVNGRILNITKNGYIDLTFDNTFYDGNNIYIYDQEWFLKDIPLEFILYRTINNFYSYNKELNNIVDINSVYNKYNLTKNIEYFKQLEENFRNEVDNKCVLDFYNSTYENVIYLKDFINNYNDLKNMLEYKENQIKDVVNAYENEVKRLNDIINSLNNALKNK